MKKINKILASVGIMSVFAFAMFVSIPQASAYEVNITTGSDLTIGSTGQNVVVLQGLLSELGYLNIPLGISQGYFGGMTRDALARYQVANSVAPAAGYYGPITKVAMHQQFAAHNWLALLGW
jgi:peptidoglycan hydrolase-like protein with peptidoglycan-binding domain